MADSNIRSNPVNVEQIMEQIRGRIRDQRGVEYTEQQIQDLAAAQLEKFLDPRQVRSDLLEEFRRLRASGYVAEPLPETGDDAALFAADRGWLRPLRLLLRPLTRLLINTRALASALVQPQLERSRRLRDQVLFELVHNLVIETTRLHIEVKNLKMRVESLSGRVEFNERRSRAVEGAVLYQPSRSEPPAPDRSRGAAAAPAFVASATPDVSHDRTGQNSSAPGLPGPGDGSGQRSRRRRRRRGRRGGGPPAGFTTPATSTSPERASDASTVHAASASDEPSSSATMHDDADLPESDEGGSDVDPQ